MSDTTFFGCPILTARKVSSLRQRMIDDMTVRNFAPNTMVAYLKQVQYFSQYFGRSPERLGSEEIRGCRNLPGQGTEGISQQSDGGSLRPTLSIRRDFETGPGHRQDPDSQSGTPIAGDPIEPGRGPTAASSRSSFPHHVIFSTMYGTGMRVSEALHLCAVDIDSQRMMIRIQQGKGHKDRYVQLSPKLLELFARVWRKVRPPEWLFPGQSPKQPLSREAVGQAVTQASPARWPRRAG